MDKYSIRNFNMMDSRGRIGILTHYRDGRIMTYDDIVAHKKNNCSEYPLY